MDAATKKGWLLDWAKRRADAYRRDEAEASGVSSMLLTWSLGGITFLAGIYIATPSAIDPSWRMVIGLGLFLVAFLGLRRLDDRISRPRAAVSRWAAERSDVLIELYLLDLIPEKEFRECADFIKASRGEWFDKKGWTRSREVKQKRDASATSPRSISRLTDPAERMKFVRGEISGPWDYLE